MILWVLSVLLLVVRIPISLLATFSLWMSTVWRRQDGETGSVIDGSGRKRGRGALPLGPLGVDEAVIQQFNEL